MSSFARDIEAETGGEPILGIVVEKNRGWIGDEDTVFPKPDVVVPWDEARPHLDYNYDTGFGGEDCHAIIAWTQSRVIFVGTYDGSTWVQWMPRNPTDTTPASVGGG